MPFTAVVVDDDPLAMYPQDNRLTPANGRIKKRGALLNETAPFFNCFVGPKHWSEEV